VNVPDELATQAQARGVPVKGMSKSFWPSSDRAPLERAIANADRFVPGSTLWRSSRQDSPLPETISRD